MGVKSDFIRIDEGISRINLKLKSIDGTEINGSGPAISSDKVEQLMVQLDALGEGDVLFLAGSIPSSMPDDMYRRIMARLEGKRRDDRCGCNERFIAECFGVPSIFDQTE